MKRIAVFASGSGSNFEAIAQAARDGKLDAEVALCVCDRPKAYVRERAKKFNVPVLQLNPKDFTFNKNLVESFVADDLKKHGVDLICLAGYMRIIGPSLLEPFRDRIVNIHPSLLPAFKGAHAIRDAFEYGVKVYGVTIHYVNEDLDGGRIIAQEAIPYDGDDLDDLEARIHAVEHRLYPATISRLLKDGPSA